MAKEQHTTQNITASNKDLEVLKKNFSHCFDKNGDFDLNKFKTELSKNEVNFSKESYGMDWLGKSYARLLASDNATTLLKEDEVFNTKEENKNSENLLIKGDNLEVLKHLSNAYYEKIKMIYIDPPYNTGSDGFVYQDDRKFTVNEFKHLAGVDEDAAKKILTFVDSKSNSHSAWLTFMYPRLYIAKQLLKEDGVIFISIDDNEVAQLKILMDEIFGEENFITQFSWQKKTGASDATGIATITENIITFSKNKNLSDETFTKNFDSFDSDRYKLSDKHLTERGEYYIDNLDRGGLNYSDSMNYGIKCPDGTMAFPNGRKEYFNDGWIWKWSKKKVEWGIENDFIEIKKSSSKNNGWGIYYKNYLFVDNENKEIERSAAHKNLLLNLLNTKGTNEIKKYFDKKIIFNNSKPTELLKNFISYTKLKENDIVLDFFAGSGTTGDAVMQINAEDDGNRKFILAQLPEKIDSKKNKTAYDFVKKELNIEIPTIFDITKERLIRASKKIYEENTDKPVKSTKVKCEGCGEDEEHCQSCKGEHTIKIEATKKKDLSNQDLGFKIFETTPIWEDYNLESDTFDEKLQLFDELQLSKEDVKALLITWKTNDGIALTNNLETIDLGKYTGYYFEDKMYLMDKGFTTDNLKTLLELIDTNKKINPASIIAFGYHFESKNLREISENIKSYANKKNIDIDFITRY